MTPEEQERQQEHIRSITKLRHPQLIMEYCLEFKDDLQTNAIALAFQLIQENYEALDSPIKKAKMSQSEIL